MKKFFLAVSGLFSSVPGLLVIWKGIATPPDYGTLFGGVMEAFGALSLVLLWVNKSKLKALSTMQASRIAIILSVLCFVFIVGYIALFGFCVVGSETRHFVYYPLWTSGEIGTMVARSGGRYAALENYGFAAVYQAIKNMPYYQLAITLTSATLLFLYQGIFTTLAVAFGILGFHKGKAFSFGG